MLLIGTSRHGNVEKLPVIFLICLTRFARVSKYLRYDSERNYDTTLGNSQPSRLGSQAETA